MLAAQTSGLEFLAQRPHKSWGTGVHVCNPNTGEAEVTCWSASLVESVTSRFSERLCL